MAKSDDWSMAGLLQVDPKAKADYLIMATNNKAMFDAHVEVGFSEDQAMAVVLQMNSTHLQTSMMIESEQGEP